MRHGVYAKLCCGRVLKRSSSAHLMQVKLLLFTFILIADCMQFLSENRLNGCQNFGRFDLLKTECELNVGFLHIPTFKHKSISA